MKKVSVIIPTHNCENSISQVLLALRSQDYPNFEVIVVDDNSSDETIKEIEWWSVRWKELKLVRNESNLGLAKSLNIGIRASSGEIIITLHDDCILLSDDWITKMVKTFEFDPKIAIVSSRFLINFKALSFWDKLFSFAYFLGDDISLESYPPSR